MDSRQSEVKRHFDEIAGNYYQIVRATPFLYGYYHVKEMAILRQILVNFLSTRKSIMKEQVHALDIGCATGRVISEMQTYATEATFIGLDISVSMAKLAKANGSNNTEFVVGDIRNLPFHDDCFDFVYALEVVEHLDNKAESIPKALCEVTRTVAKSGLLVLESSSLHHLRVQDSIRKIVLRLFPSSRGSAARNIIPTKFREIYLRAPLSVAEPSALPFIVRALERGDAHVKSTYWIRVIPELVFAVIENQVLKRLLLSIDETLTSLPVLQYLGREFIIVSQKANGK